MDPQQWDRTATLPRFCTWQPGLSRSPQFTSVPVVKEFDGISERRKSLKLQLQCPTVKAVPKHGLNSADLYPARGESRLGSSLHSISSRKCNLPYEICLWERISNRIIRKGRINMEKAPMDGQNHYNFSAVWWTEQCPSELEHTSLTWASLGWKTGIKTQTQPPRLEKSHCKCNDNTFLIQLSPCRKRWCCHCCLHGEFSSFNPI